MHRSLQTAHHSMKTLLSSLFAMALAITASAQTAFDHTHMAFTAILQSQVNHERVDYAALKKNSAPLKSYLDTLSAVQEAEFKSWGKSQRLAFLINLYNAATLQLVLDHYPVKSIKDIGGFFSGPWKQPVVRAFKKTFTLDQIEHDMIRPQYNEPRAHFAVNCASIGCPALRAEAYDAARLNEQLDEQGRAFLGTTSKNRVDAKSGTLYLSPIFKWFAEDFTDEAGTVEKFVAPYFNETDRVTILSGSLEIEYTDYSWALNKQ